jgi:hypothetical protein
VLMAGSSSHPRMLREADAGQPIHVRAVAPGVRQPMD